MGEKVIEKFERIKWEYKFTFFLTLVLGICIHMYKFTNTLLGHDSVLYYYDKQDMLVSGRCFLSIACGISSFLDLLWVNGLLSLVYIAVATSLIVGIFQCRNKVLICLVSGLMVSFPAVTETFFYQFAADGYMLAMLLAVWSLYLTRLENKKIRNYVFSTIILVLCCGIYQAYLCFGMVLTVCYFIYVLLDGKFNWKESMIWLMKKAGQFIICFGIYTLIWKLLLKIRGVEAISYQGMDKLGTFNLRNSLLSIGKGCGKIIFNWNSKNIGKINIYNVLMVTGIMLFVVVLAVIVYRQKLWKEKIKMILLAISVVGLPILAFVFAFSNETGVSYGARMLYSIVLILILMLVLAEKWTKGWLADVTALVMLCLVFVFAVQGNKAYFYMDAAQKKTYANGCILLERAYEAGVRDEKEQKVLIIGSLSESAGYTGEGAEELGLFWGLLEQQLFTSEERIISYMNNTFKLNWKEISEKEKEELSDCAEVKDMECWPDKASVKMIDDVLVLSFE